MSAGATVLSKYQDTKLSTNIRPIRIQPETLALEINSVANAAPTGAQNAYPSAQVSSGKRSIGVNARTVTIKFSGTPPTGYKADSPITLPWLTATTFGAIDVGQTGTYLETAIVVLGTSAEKVR